MSLWPVLPERDREQWNYVPTVGVGPLRFGMTGDEAVAALDGFTGYVPPPDSRARDQNGLFRRHGDPAYETALYLYFDQPDGLYCVVPDARYGPQVILDGMRLVGQPPSQWEADLTGYLGARGMPLRYSPGGDAGSDELGIITSVQRAGDVVLTRPVLLVQRAWAYTLWDMVPAGEGDIYS
ncbi:hypothetical protein ACFO1B_48460 [Dactylosporangium siamense]|uniref:Uncharacterized protein n=1 Tax=Dactylosporangium siamense TaxID=685454 RepID=A0A919PXI9_9ACTN|nr:hypothetical protein [Dactylosporangium siamense]GIG52231.1 hypothetical protein Dsi01nite_102720 [Dactylosporangium siamense]